MTINYFYYSPLAHSTLPAAFATFSDTPCAGMHTNKLVPELQHAVHSLCGDQVKKADLYSGFTLASRSKVAGHPSRGEEEKEQRVEYSVHTSCLRFGHHRDTGFDGHLSLVKYKLLRGSSLAI